MYDFLGVEVNTNKHSVKVTLTQGGLTKKVLKKLVMLDSNKKITPAATMLLGSSADGTTFDEPWECASIVVIFMYLSRKYKPDIQFAVHQCTRFTHNPNKSKAESVNTIFRYLVVTQDKGSTFDPNSDMKLD